MLFIGAALLLSFRPLGAADAKPGSSASSCWRGSEHGGQAVVDLDHEEHYNGGRGTLAKLLEEPGFEARWGWVRDGEGDWEAREDVGVWYRSAHEEKKGPLSIGYAVYGGRHHFGPELALGKVLGDRFDDPVLLVKACWEARASVDFRPPSAGGKAGPYFGRMFKELDAALADVGAASPVEGARGRGLRVVPGVERRLRRRGDAQLRREPRALDRRCAGTARFEELPVVVGQTGNMKNPALHAAQRAGAKGPARTHRLRETEASCASRRTLRTPPTAITGSACGEHLLIGEALGESMIDSSRSRGDALRAARSLTLGSLSETLTTILRPAGRRPVRGLGASRGGETPLAAGSASKLAHWTGNPTLVDTRTSRRQGLW